MIRVVLLSDQGWPATQPWWWRFVGSVDQDIESINTELLNWSAQLWQHGGAASYKSSYIDFYDEQAYTWFVLRWS